MTCVQTSRETMPRIEVRGLLDKETSDADQWCSVRKGCANDPFPPCWVEKFMFTFHLTEKLKFNSRFPSLYASEARTKNKRIQSIRAVDCMTGLPTPSKACTYIFMHITKSLIKSTSNCRHRNQSQLPHPRHSRLRIWLRILHEVSEKLPICEKWKRIKGMRQKAMARAQVQARVEHFL